MRSPGPAALAVGPVASYRRPRAEPSLRGAWCTVTELRAPGGHDLAMEADVGEHRLAALGRRVLDHEVEEALGFDEVHAVACRRPEEESDLRRGGDLDRIARVRKR